MISVRVKYYMGIENFTGTPQETISFGGGSVGKLIDQIVDKHPSFNACFKEEKGDWEPAPGISVLVNGREIMWLEKMATLLAEGDEIVFLRFVSGGSSAAGGEKVEPFFLRRR